MMAAKRSGPSAVRWDGTDFISAIIKNKFTRIICPILVVLVRSAGGTHIDRHLPTHHSARATDGTEPDRISRGRAKGAVRRRDDRGASW